MRHGNRGNGPPRAAPQRMSAFRAAGEVMNTHSCPVAVIAPARSDNRRAGYTVGNLRGQLGVSSPIYSDLCTGAPSTPFSN